MAKTRLMNELQALQKEKWCTVEPSGGSNLFKWNVNLMVVNSDSYYDGGYFKAQMTFPSNYPMSPPSFKFLRPIYHPNIYPDGRICISILHPAGEDEMSGESATERWTSVQSVESVLRSILLLLDDPEVSSPANVDAGVLYRNDRGAFIVKASDDVAKSKADIPEGFTLPTTLVDAPPPKIVDDDDFWNESDGEDDFGGSDSSGDDADMNDFDDEDEDQEFDDSDENPSDDADDVDKN